MEYSRKIVSIIKEMRNNPNQEKIDKLINVSSILSSLFTVLFFLFDHRVFLAEVQLLVI